MTQYEKNHSKDDSYSIMEKLRYNDYDLLVELTESLMKGDSISIQNVILETWNVKMKYYILIAHAKKVIFQISTMKQMQNIVK